MSDPSLRVTKKEKLKTKKKMNKVTDKIKRTLTNRKLRKQLDEQEMTPLLAETFSSNLDMDDNDSSDKKDGIKKYSSNKVKRLKSKLGRQISSRIHSSVEETMCLIQSDMDAESEKADRNSPAVGKVALSNKEAVSEATASDVGAGKRKCGTKAEKLNLKKNEKNKLELVVDERRLKRIEARKLRRQKSKVSVSKGTILAE